MVLNNIIYINLKRYNWDEPAINLHKELCVFLSVLAPWTHKMSINPLGYLLIAQESIICLQGGGFEECSKTNRERKVMKGM
jgi:hypothetical protein